MRAAVLGRKGEVRIARVPLPKTPAGGALLRVAAVGICGSDLHKIGLMPAGTVLGHEVAGVVERAGRGLERFRRGDRIVTAHHIPCGRCFYCRRGHPSQCSLFRSTNLDPGGWAEYVALSPLHLRRVTFPLPRHLDDGEASLTEPLACCIRAVRRAEPKRGETFVVIGLGPVGLMLAFLLRHRGVRVLGLDRLPAKTKKAASWAGALPLPARAPSARREVLSRTDGRGADQVILSAGVASAFPLALDLVRPGGTVHLFSGPDEGVHVDFDPNRLYKREVRLLASYSSSPADLREAFRWIREGRIPVSGLISHRLPLERIGEGIERIREGEAWKVILEPHR